MTGLDIVVLLVVGLSAILGFSRGFVQEMMALAAWIVALFAIHFFHEPLSIWLEPRIGTPSGSGVLAFALLLLVPYIVMKMMAKWAGSTSRKSVLGPIDRVLGLGFGGLKGLILVVLAFSVLVLGYDTVWGPSGRPTWISQARTYPFINAASDALVTSLRERRASLAAEQTSADDAP